MLKIERKIPKLFLHEHTTSEQQGRGKSLENVNKIRAMKRKSHSQTLSEKFSYCFRGELHNIGISNLKSDFLVFPSSLNIHEYSHWFSLLLLGSEHEKESVHVLKDKIMKFPQLKLLYPRDFCSCKEKRAKIFVQRMKKSEKNPLAATQGKV